MSGACVHLRVAQEHYALPVVHVLEVAKLEEPTPVPGAPASLTGVINRHGQVLAVVDLASVLGVGSAGQPDRVIVVDDGHRRAGLAVDEIIDVGPMPALTEAGESDLLAGAALIDGLLVGLLEIAPLLDAAAGRGGVGHAR